MNEKEANEIQQLPTQYKPISAFGYWGYNILFSIPLIGLIFLIIYAFDSSNINRRNYARSFFIGIVIIVIIVLILTISGIGIFGVLSILN